MTRDKAVWTEAIEYLSAPAGYTCPSLLGINAGLCPIFSSNRARTSDDREKAIELQDEAISIATELGMKPLLERVLAKREILKA